MTLLCCTAAVAQNFPNGLTTDSVDPAADSLFFSRMRERMDSIRRTEHRPTVALVLSGGGAKGAAQVGALRYLEQTGIPIDLVCGTSIGGMLGGMYAVGYDSGRLAQLFMDQDWNVMLSDYVDPVYIPYSMKMYNSRYLISIPFDTASEVFDSRMPEGPGYRRQTFLGSLPSGMVYGFNVNNLLSSLTVGWQDSLSFAELPVPFVCVATDVVSGKAKNWVSGSLNTAVRSTMSIPGLFEPVRSSGMVLVDGGTRNNFPTDIARAAGADYIIGIELSDSKAGYEDVNNIVDIAMQFVDMLGGGAFQTNVKLPDVTIKPDIPEYNMMSFSREAVDTMLRRGYAAAQRKAAELQALKEKVGGGRAAVLDGAVNIAETPVEIGEIVFNGVGEKEAAIISKLLSFEEGATVGKKELDEVMSRFQATGAFSSVTWSLLGHAEPYVLAFEFVKAPANNIGLGFRIDSEEWASLLFNFGLNTNSMTGSRLNFTAKLGQNLKADIHYSLDFPRFPAINLTASISQYRGDLGTPGSKYAYNASYWTHKELLYLTDVRWTRLNFEAGFKNQYINLDRGTHLGSMIEESFSEEALKGDYLGVFANGHLYTFDDYYYPSKGTSLSFGVNYDFIKPGDSSFRPVLTVAAGFRTVVPLGGKLAFIPEINLRGVLSTGENTDGGGHVYKDISVLHTNFVGGDIAGRYTDSQIPFFGLDNVTIADEYLTTVALELRYNPARRFYVSAMTGIIESNDSASRFIPDFSPDIWAVGAEFAYDSVAGPIKLNCHWSNTNKWGVYVSFGFDF